MEGGAEIAEKVECLIEERMWKYESVARTKTKTIVSMGAVAVRAASARESARILDSNC
jgi:hypothetical protein